MAWMVAHAEFLLNYLADQRRGPDASFQTVGDRTAVEDVLKLLVLVRGQVVGPAAAMSFEQSGLALLVPVFNPQRHRRAMDFQDARDLAGGVAFDAQGDAVESLGDARLLIVEGLLAQFQKQRHGSLIASGKNGPHNCQSLPAPQRHVEFFMRVHIEWAVSAAGRSVAAFSFGAS